MKNAFEDHCWKDLLNEEIRDVYNLPGARPCAASTIEYGSVFRDINIGKGRLQCWNHEREGACASFLSHHQKDGQFTDEEEMTEYSTGLIGSLADNKVFVSPEYRNRVGEVSGKGLD
jgi:hypothetical protein